MRKTLSVAIAAALTLTFTAAPSFASIEKPSMEHKGQWWTNSKGCRYSRVGAPGELMWFLVINTEAKGCPSYIKMVSNSKTYKEFGPLK